jgi:hypothetical protein
MTETWSMRWSRSSGGEIGAGAAFNDTTEPDGSSSNAWELVGTANAWYALLLRALEARFQWNVGLRPDVSALTGTFQHGLFTSVRSELRVERSSARLELAASQTLPRDAPGASNVLSADLALSQALLDWLDLELGGQVARQRIRSGGPLAATGSRWLLYAGLVGRLPEVRF